MAETIQSASFHDRLNSVKGKAVTRTVIQSLVWVFAAAVFLQNVLLQREDKVLRAAQSTMVPKGVYLQAAAPPVVVGRRLQKITGVALDGKLDEINLDSGRFPGTLIVTFSPGCVNCIRNQRGWTELVRGLKAKGWRVIWVSRDPRDITSRYCELNGVNLPDVVADPTHRTFVQLGLAAVPNTIAVDPLGVVQQVWSGQLTEESWSDMFGHFELPHPQTPLSSYKLAASEN